MRYRILLNHLWSTAEAAKKFCQVQWGIAEKRIRVETPILDGIGFVTTLHANMRDHQVLCIEVAERAYPGGLDSFILECKNLVLPVRLFVAIPQGSSVGSSDLIWARKNGVGIIELQDSNATIIQDSLSLSLTGVRTPDLKDFPAKYRHAVSEALSTFRNGNPSKGCGVLYDELESLTHQIATKAMKKGFWKGLPRGQAAPRLKPATQPWAKVVQTLVEHFDVTKTKCPKLNSSLLGRILGVTEYRNESAHKPKNLEQLRKRDREMRTRFESVSDLMLAVIVASRGL